MCYKSLCLILPLSVRSWLLGPKVWLHFHSPQLKPRAIPLLGTDTPLQFVLAPWESWRGEDGGVLRRRLDLYLNVEPRVQGCCTSLAWTFAPSQCPGVYNDLAPQPAARKDHTREFAFLAEFCRELGAARLCQCISRGHRSSGECGGGDAGGQAQWQLSGSGALALSKKGANLIAVCISREHKSVFAFQGCVRALCADYIQCSGCCTDAPKKQPWSGEVIIKEHLAERWVCECPDGNCKPCSSPNPVSRLLEADVLLSGGS